MAKKSLKLKLTKSDKSVNMAKQQDGIKWANFEQFWNASVKNGTPLLLASCKAHLKALGVLNKPSKWVESVQHFGIKIEE